VLRAENSVAIEERAVATMVVSRSERKSPKHRLEDDDD
jgi:hypothetical protein